eukprot:1090533-Amphidinium_carterae.1
MDFPISPAGEVYILNAEAQRRGVTQEAAFTSVEACDYDKLCQSVLCSFEGAHRLRHVFTSGLNRVPQLVVDSWQSEVGVTVEAAVQRCGEAIRRSHDSGAGCFKDGQ